MPTVELNTEVDQQTAQRFPGWMSLSVFSAICVAAISSATKHRARESDEKWALAVTVISMCFSFVAVLAYLFVRGLYAGQAFEAATLALILGFWAAGLPVIMNPNNAIAVGEGFVLNANLYFFSWGSLASVLYLVGNFMQEAQGYDVQKIVQSSKKQAQYLGMAAASTVFLVATVRMERTRSCHSDDYRGTGFCKRANFGISLGVIGFVFGMVLAYCTGKGMELFLECVACAILLVLWCFGVGFTTFGDDSPGSSIGNLYFASWISFILALVLFGSCVSEYMAARAASPMVSSNNNNNGTVTNPEQQPPHPDDHQVPEFTAEEEQM